MNSRNLPEYTDVVEIDGIYYHPHEAKEPDVVELDKKNAKKGKSTKTKEFKQFKSGATKDKEGKLRLDLVSPEMIEALGTVLTYGAQKYDDRNWEKGIPFMDTIAASQRHLMKFLKGEDIDEESGLNHIEQAFLNLGMVVTQIRRNRTDLDNRSKK